MTAVDTGGQPAAVGAARLSALICSLLAATPSHTTLVPTALLWLRLCSVPWRQGMTSPLPRRLGCGVLCVVVLCVCVVASWGQATGVPSAQRAWRLCSWLACEQPPFDDVLIVVVRAGQALVDLYNATNGPEWSWNTNWLNGDPCSQQWYAVGCLNDTVATMYVRKTGHTSAPSPLTAFMMAQRPHQQSTERHHSIIDWISRESHYLVRTIEQPSSAMTTIIIQRDTHSMIRWLRTLMHRDIEQAPLLQSIERHHSIIDWISCDASVLVRRIEQPSASSNTIIIQRDTHSMIRWLRTLAHRDIDQRSLQQSIGRHHSIIDWISREA